MNKFSRALSYLALSSTLFACGSKSAEEHLELARKYVADAEHRSAIIELKNALRADSGSAEARWLLGKTYLETGDLPSAEKELRQAQELQWPAGDILPLLGEVLLGQEKYAAVRELSPAGLPPPAAARLLAAQGIAELEQGELDAATDRITEGLTADPDNAQARQAQALLLMSRKDLSTAASLLDQLLEEDHGDWRTWTLRSEIYQQQGQWREAVDALNEALKIYPPGFSQRVRRALLELQLGEVDAAVADAKQLMKRAPQHPSTNYVQGVIDFQQENYQEAINHLSAANPSAEQYPQALLLLGIAHLRSGHSDQANVFAERYHYAVPAAATGRILLATLRLQQGRNDEVVELLEPLLQSRPDDLGLMNLMANALIATGATDRGIELLSRVVELQPDSPAARVRLGASLLIGGNQAEANDVINEALELDPQYQQADVLLIVSHLTANDYPGAIAAAKSYRQRNPADPQSYNILGRVYLAANQPDDARAAFTRALQIAPGDPTANHNLAQLALAEDDRDTAIDYYNRVLKETPNHLPTLIRLAEMAQQAGDSGLFEDYLRRAMEGNPGSLQPRLLLAQHFLKLGRHQQVANLFSSLPAMQKQSPQVLLTLAQAQLAGGDFSGAQVLLNQLEDVQDNAPVHYLRARVAAGQNNLSVTREELETALSLDPNFTPALVAMAKLALEEERDKTFEDLMQRLLTLAPDNADVIMLQAAQATKAGDLDSAVNFAKRAFQQTPTSVTADGLADYYEAAGRNEEALQVRNDWLKQNPKDPLAHMGLADQLQRMQETEAAQQHYLSVVELQPDNVIALNNIAWNLRRIEPEEAREYARKAATLAPDSAPILDTLAVIEHINGENERAYRTVNRALARWPDHPSLRYHKAMIAAQLDRVDEAIAILEKLQAAAATYPESEDAARLLSRLQATQAGN